jgi:hypothetical protein
MQESGFFPEMKSRRIVLPATRPGGKTMNKVSYERQAERELHLAAQARSPEERKHHLNKAAEYSTLDERLRGLANVLVG